MQAIERCLIKMHFLKVWLLHTGPTKVKRILVQPWIVFSIFQEYAKTIESEKDRLNLLEELKKKFLNDLEFVKENQYNRHSWRGWYCSDWINGHDFSNEREEVYVENVYKCLNPEIDLIEWNEHPELIFAPKRYELEDDLIITSKFAIIDKIVYTKEGKKVELITEGEEMSFPVLNVVKKTPEWMELKDADVHHHVELLYASKTDAEEPRYVGVIHHGNIYARMMLMIAMDRYHSKSE